MRMCKKIRWKHQYEYEYKQGHNSQLEWYKKEKFFKLGRLPFTFSDHKRLRKLVTQTSPKGRNLAGQFQKTSMDNPLDLSRSSTEVKNTKLYLWLILVLHIAAVSNNLSHGHCLPGYPKTGSRVRSWTLAFKHPGQIPDPKQFIFISLFHEYLKCLIFLIPFFYAAIQKHQHTCIKMLQLNSQNG